MNISKQYRAIVLIGLTLSLTLLTNLGLMIMKSKAWSVLIWKSERAYLISLSNFLLVGFMRNASSVDWRNLASSYYDIWKSAWFVSTFLLGWWISAQCIFSLLLIGIAKDITVFFQALYRTVIKHLVSSRNFGKVWKRCSASIAILVFIRRAIISEGGWPIKPVI